MSSKSSQQKNVKVKILIRGIYPILMNPATEELLNQLPGAGISAGAKKPNKDRTREEIAESRVIRDKKTKKVGIPVEYMYSCLKEAGRHVIFEGKKKISTADSTLLFSFMSIDEQFFPFIDQDSGYEIDVRRGVNRTTKGAQAIVRPRFDTWAFYLTIEVDTNEINLEKVRMVFDQAGKKIGLADFRPTCNGPFGRFVVEEWKEISA
ncbi:MAG: hypothetical protein R3B60_04770 [Candidatus Paceibacterota bacterium]